MTDQETTALAALLAATEDAHGVYETAELDGVYDDAWPRWYAAYAIDHGIERLIGREIDVHELAVFLTASWRDSQESVDAGTPWAEETARRIAAAL